jgi:glycosyltransferase involved in cell wall biosynthesis
LSVVVPVYNEAENVAPLLMGILEQVRSLGLQFEIVIVDDCSSDGTEERLRALLRETPELVVLRLKRNFGQTLALLAGLDRARGDAIVTMDGDLQNDPRDIPRLLEELANGADVVSGWRRHRRDSLLIRRIPSWVANWLIRRLTRTSIHDHGCSLKAYRREVAERLDLYADMHRFIALVAVALGASVREIEVRHHPRVAGSSNYGLGRTFQVLADVFNMQMLTRFREHPMHRFALLGSPFLVAAFVSSLLALWTAGGSVVYTAVAFLTATTFGTCLLFGVLGEAVIEGATGARSRKALFHEWKGA